MKKTLSLIFVLMLTVGLFAGCKSPTEEQPEKTNVKVINPLPLTIDMEDLDNCTVAVSLEEGGAYVDDTGKMQMDVKVYAYDLYDMVDIATLSINDIIVRRNEEVTVSSIEVLDTGLIHINGGEEEGGFSLTSDNSTVYYEVGMSDAKAYYELGEATIRVSTEFRYTDESDPEGEAKIYYPGDFLIADAGIEYNFRPNNTTIVIQDGFIIAMKKVYTP